MTLVDGRELVLACLCHAVARVILRVRGLPALLRFSRLKLPRSHVSLAEPRLATIARTSGVVCRGSCLTETVVRKLLMARHGHARQRLTIGVRLAGGRLHAHAWAGEGDESQCYVPLWTETACEASPRR